LSFRHFGDGYAVLLLSLWIGIGFIFQGIAGIAAGIGESELPGRGWYIVAVLTLAAGIWLTIIGITQIIQAFQTREARNTARKTIDEAARHATTR
jgi:uncharacterized membrane protein HdeD (DUF308 family)